MFCRFQYGAKHLGGFKKHFALVLFQMTLEQRVFYILHDQLFPPFLADQNAKSICCCFNHMSHVRTLEPDVKKFALPWSTLTLHTRLNLYTLFVCLFVCLLN